MPADPGLLRTRLSPRVGLSLCVVLAVLGPLILVVMVNNSLHLLALASCSVMVISFPIVMRRKPDWFSSWNFLAYSVFLGVFIRSLYIVFDYPSPFAIQEVFLLGRPKEFLIWPAILVLVGLMCVTLGFVCGPRAVPPLRLKVFEFSQWNPWRFNGTICFLLVLSWTGIYFFIDQTTGWELTETNISGLRGTSVDLSEYRSYGYLRFLAGFSDTVCYLVIARVITDRKVRLSQVIVFLSSLATSILFQFFVSTRGTLAFLFVNMLALVYYFRGRKLPVSALLVIGFLALILVRVTTSYRAGGGYDTSENWLGGSGLREGSSTSSAQDLLRVADPIVLSGNLIEISKTAHILEAIPDRLPYEWGRTLLTGFFAWIPRELWPEKPVANVDNEIGRVVFGYDAYGASGVPPGLVAEMFWNFSFPGVIMGCLFLGYLLRVIEAYLSAYAGQRNITLLYVVSFMLLGLSFMGSSVTMVIIGWLVSFVPMYLVLHFITERRGKSLPDTPASDRTVRS